MGIIAIDDRGRVTIPKEDRDRAGIKVGDKLRIKVERKKIILEKVVNADTLIAELEGCIQTPGDVDPLDLKKIWGLTM
ncbi:MAG: AbrB/MazE/SpoVT family DNA-binding domain-containing protein [Candidatus Heimdallarchaeota archaeon]